MSVRSFQELIAVNAVDKPKPRIVDTPCVLCEQLGTRHNPVVVQPGQHHGMHYPCAQKNAERVRAIQAVLDNKETP